MNCYLATWSWPLTDGRRQEVTMTFWANDSQAAVSYADDFWRDFE